MKMKRVLLWLLLLLCSTVAWATVGTQNYTVTYTCTGGLGPYPFTFPISDPTALTVTMNGNLLPSTDYTIVSVNNNYNNGGSITLGGSFPCQAGWFLILARVTPVTQAIKFYNNMPIPMSTFERGLDKLTEIDQELEGIFNGNIVGSIQMQNNGVNYNPPAVGNVILDYTNCVVAGTGIDYTITCPS